MPRGPKGEKRPADVIGNAVHVMWIATEEIEESFFANFWPRRRQVGKLPDHFIEFAA